jgi:GTP:adenosylcobinamide-phosphate guanylyltransferase
MFILSGGRGTGKTKALLERVKAEDATIVCEDTMKMRERAYGYGITGLNIISYEEFDALEKVEEPVYIHNINKYISYGNRNVKGYSVCNE